MEPQVRLCTQSRLCFRFVLPLSLPFLTHALFSLSQIPIKSLKRRKKTFKEEKAKKKENLGSCPETSRGGQLWFLLQVCQE